MKLYYAFYIMLAGAYTHACQSFHAVEFGGVDLVETASSIEAAKSAPHAATMPKDAAATISLSRSKVGKPRSTTLMKDASAPAGGAGKSTGETAGASLKLPTDLMYVDSPLFAADRVTVSLSGAKLNTTNSKLTAKPAAAVSEEEIVYMDNPMLAKSGGAGLGGKPSPMATESAMASSVTFGDFISSPVFSVTRDTTKPFDVQMILIRRQVEGPLKEFIKTNNQNTGIAALRILGIDPATIVNPETGVPQPLTPDTAKALLIKIAQDAHALQLSLQWAQKYEDFSPDGLKKINDTYNNGSWSKIPPADLETVNEALARISFPQITPDFSDNTLVRFFSKSGSANLKSLVAEALPTITTAADTAEAYLNQFIPKK